MQKSAALARVGAVMTVVMLLLAALSLRHLPMAAATQAALAVCWGAGAVMARQRQPRYELAVLGLGLLTAAGVSALFLTGAAGWYGVVPAALALGEIVRVLRKARRVAPPPTGGVAVPTFTPRLSEGIPTVLGGRTTISDDAPDH